MPLPIELADALAAASGVSESSHGARYDPAKLSRFTELLATHAAKPVSSLASLSESLTCAPSHPRPVPNSAHRAEDSLWACL